VRHDQQPAAAFTPGVHAPGRKTPSDFAAIPYYAGSMPLRPYDARIDDAARHELDAEAERHRRALEGLTTRDTEALVTEANRHLDRVGEIMVDLARRAGALALSVAGLCAVAS
jgi:hypothetical protein